MFFFSDVRVRASFLLSLVKSIITNTQSGNKVTKRLARALRDVDLEMLHYLGGIASGWVKENP